MNTEISNEFMAESSSSARASLANRTFTLWTLDVHYRATVMTGKIRHAACPFQNVYQ